MDNLIQNFKQRFVITLIVTLALTLLLVSPSWRIAEASPPTPTSFEDAKLLASDGASGDSFSNSVAVSGNTAVVGARLDDDQGPSSGSVYVFVKSAGNWIEEAKITPSDGQDFDLFGKSVSISGDTIVVGSQDDDNGGDAGAAYVFVRNAGLWSEQAKLLASDGFDGDGFGEAVSIDGDTIIVGADRDDDNGLDSGSAYIYVRSAGVWTEQAKLLASDGATRDDFGQSVAVSGNKAIVAAWRDDDGGTSTGSVYIFDGTGGTWTQQQKLTASDANVDDLFGTSVSISGSVAVIGANNTDDVGVDSGSAYVFVEDAGSWVENSKLTASDAMAKEHFGVAVSIDGDTLLVGATGDSLSGSGLGSGYLFTRSGGIWSEDQKLLASDAASFDNFGHMVAISDGTAILAATADDDNGLSSGSAYIFEVAPPNSAPTIAGASPGTSQGSPSSNQLIANVADTEDSDDSLLLTINGGSSATVNGVSVSNIVIAPNGDVLADIEAADCTSSNANFALQVTDSGGLNASATLSVAVSAEMTPPVIDPISDVVAVLAPGSTATSAVVSFPNPTASDNCSIPVATASPVSGSLFPIGETTVNVGAVDDAGNNADPVTFTVRVLYNFAGFFNPIDNLELNNVKAGRGIPIKFSLSGDKGLNIMAAGYPASYSIPCNGNGEDGEEIPTVTAGNSSLSYDPVEDQYNYVWKTDKVWKNTCRRLVVQLNDGSIHTADFKFK